MFVKLAPSWRSFALVLSALFTFFLAVAVLPSAASWQEPPESVDFNDRQQCSEASNPSLVESLRAEFDRGQSLLQRRAVASQVQVPSVSEDIALGNGLPSATAEDVSSSGIQTSFDQAGARPAADEMALWSQSYRGRFDKAGTAHPVWDLASALLVSGGMVCCHAAFFSYARRRYPQTYSKGWLTGRAPFPAGDGLFEWVRTSMLLKAEDVTAAAGLDAAMMLEFMNLSRTTLLLIGLPTLFVLCPLHLFFGGASASDPLHAIDLVNVQSGSTLCWIHALVVWTVVLGVYRIMRNAHGRFVTLRYDWLRKMQPPRSTTCLVQNIPLQHCSDEKLKSFVDGMFSGTDPVVEQAYIVKRLPESLSSDFQCLQDNKGKLREAELAWERDDKDPAKRPKHFSEGGDEVDSLEHCSSLMKSAAERVRATQALISTSAKTGDPEVCSQGGFVTFKLRRDTELALTMAGAENSENVMFGAAPDPMDVRYDALQLDPGSQHWERSKGYMLLVLLYLSYLPMVAFICVATSLVTLRRIVPGLDRIATDHPALASMWDGMVAQAAITLFIGFVPTFLLSIIKGFFAVPAETACQVQLENYYFHFQVVFVLFIFCIGNSLLATWLTLVTDPSRIFVLLASTLPRSAYFFLNFIPLQYVVHVSELCRYINLLKYLFYRTSMDDESAYELSEPEDQDYYGMGARTSRSSLLFVIPLVFCTVSPLICFLGVINFFISRVVFGYLVVFAETKKADTGGEFWCSQLRHVQYGLLIYITLMVGILFEKGGLYGPGLFASLGYVYVIYAHYQFSHLFQLPRLPLQDVVDLQSASESVGKYVQPELDSEFDKSSSYCLQS